MDTMKSPELSIYLECLLRILRETAHSCHLTDLDTAKDVEYIRGRVAHHGLTFLTDVLPKLGKAFDKCLSLDISFSDIIASTDGLNISVDSSGLPRFLGAFWKLIFDSHQLVANLDGDELAIQVCAVRAVRQVSYLMYKLDVPYADNKVDSVLDNFIRTEQSLPEAGDQITLSLETRSALTGARVLLSRVLQGFDPKAIVPAHGPGAVATGEKPWSKMDFRRFYPHLDEEYSYPEYFYFNYTHLSDSLETLELLEETPEACARVALVPKDSRGPRIISMEPLEIQWIQQGVGRALMKHIEHTDPCRGYVNFTSQEVNRSLAALSSINQGESNSRLITVDMKDASDRVSLWLVEQLLPLHCLRAFKACRSQVTELPSGDRLRLRKFAPMGSALCFPLEALVFWAIAVCAVNTVRRYRDMTSLTPIYVYGDDLIIPYWAMSKIRPVFEEVFLRFNEDKCSIGRFFRESCGLDAFQGVDVSPVRIKHRITGELSPAATLAYVSYVNSLRERGYCDTADYLAGLITSRFGRIPLTNVKGKHSLAFCDPKWDNEDCLGYNLATFGKRYNKRLQRYEINVPTVSARVFKRGRPDWRELLRLHGSYGQYRWGLCSDEVERACRFTVPHTERVRGVWADVLSFIR